MSRKTGLFILGLYLVLTIIISLVMFLGQVETLNVTKGVVEGITSTPIQLAWVYVFNALVSIFIGGIWAIFLTGAILVGMYILGWMLSKGKDEVESN